MAITFNCSERQTSICSTKRTLEMSASVHMAGHLGLPPAGTLTSRLRGPQRQRWQLWARLACMAGHARPSTPTAATAATAAATRPSTSSPPQPGDTLELTCSDLAFGGEVSLPSRHLMATWTWVCASMFCLPQSSPCMPCLAASPPTAPSTRTLRRGFAGWTAGSWCLWTVRCRGSACWRGCCRASARLRGRPNCAAWRHMTTQPSPCVR